MHTIIASSASRPHALPLPNSTLVPPSEQLAFRFIFTADSTSCRSLLKRSQAHCASSVATVTVTTPTLHSVTDLLTAANTTISRLCCSRDTNTSTSSSDLQVICLVCQASPQPSTSM
uniref:Uncharacterized protein n=1 Tax=Mesocestoides corti TaxID=53468 RepID=A0A5K3FD89_MESCO